MKKILSSVLLIMTFSANAEIDFFDFKDKYLMEFSAENNPICGYVMNMNAPIKQHRLHGNIKYDKRQKGINDGTACSFNDKGIDATSQLVIYLYPSVGGFNLQGIGSLDEMIKKYVTASDPENEQKEYLLKIIAGMYKVANNCRNDGEGSWHSLKEKLTAKLNKTNMKEKTRATKINSKLDNFIIQYFSIDLRKIKDKKQFREYIEGLINAIEGSVQIEESQKKKIDTMTNPSEETQANIPAEESEQSYSLEETQSDTPAEESKQSDQLKKEDIYPDYYTNYLISSYVWQRLTVDQIPDLLKNLGSNNDGSYSALAEQIHRDVASGSSMPFKPKAMPISNGAAYFKGESFADCGETMFRQFMATLLCERTVSKNGEFIGKVQTALNRIPDKSPLKKFFESASDIYAAANNGGSECRNEWAEIVSGHGAEGVLYHGDSNLRSYWSNYIVLFCHLMKDYSAKKNGNNAKREQEAEARIKEINKRVSELKKGEKFNPSSEEVEKIIQDLVKIRSDVELNVKLLSSKHTDRIKISVEGENIVLAFCVKKGEHSYLEIKDNEEQMEEIGKNTQEQDEIVKKPWIEQLYYAPKYALTGSFFDGDNPEKMYKFLTNMKYLPLGLYFAIGGGIRAEHYGWLYSRMLNYGNIDEVSIAEFYYGETPLSRDFVFSSRISWHTARDLGNKESKEREKRYLNFLRNVIKYAVNKESVDVAFACMTDKREKLSFEEDLLLQINGNYGITKEMIDCYGSDRFYNDLLKSINEGKIKDVQLRLMELIFYTLFDDTQLPSGLIDLIYSDECKRNFWKTFARLSEKRGLTSRKMLKEFVDELEDDDHQLAELYNELFETSEAIEEMTLYNAKDFFDKYKGKSDEIIKLIKNFVKGRLLNGPECSEVLINLISYLPEDKVLSNLEIAQELMNGCRSSDLGASIGRRLVKERSRLYQEKYRGDDEKEVIKKFEKECRVFDKKFLENYFEKLQKICDRMLEGQNLKSKIEKGRRFLFNELEIS